MVCIFCRSTRHDYRSCTVAAASVAKPLAQDYVGKAPNVFIGRYGYPRVRVGILGTQEYNMHDDPVRWSAQGTQIPEIVRLRSQLINSYTDAHVKGAPQRLVELSRDVSLARRPVDVEVLLASKPRFRMTYTRDVAPHGPNVALRDAKVTQNVPIDRKVEQAQRATDLRATDAVEQLSRAGTDPYAITKAFSMGNFGIPAERKIVPTRWSITAVDDIIAKRALETVRTLPVGDCLAFFGGHLGNHYLLLFFDDVWQYELFEHHLSTRQLWTDAEPHGGRTAYAKETAGGYYAARIGIANALAARKRQQAVLAIRIITDEYTNPLGVWVVREAVKKALATTPVRLADRTLLVQYGKEILRRTFGYDAQPLLERSAVMKDLFGQKRLTQY